MIVGLAMLKRFNGCVSVRGDLEFRNITETPVNLSTVRAVAYIKGSLKIENSPGFLVFTLPSLKSIENFRRGPALVIQNNSNLTRVDLPLLQSVYSVNSPEVVIRNNPKLLDGEKLHEIPKKLSVESEHGSRDSMYVDNDSARSLFGLSRTDFRKIHQVSIPLFILILAFCGGLLWALIRKSSCRKNRESTLPSPNYVMSPKAEIILQSLCQDIFLLNPLIWKFQERRYLWPLFENNCEKPEFLLKVHEGFARNHILPLANNASLTLHPDGPVKNQFLVFNRVKALLTSTSVVLIGTDANPRCVIPEIPILVDQQHIYEYNANRIGLRLINVGRIGRSTQSYTYSVSASGEAKATKSVVTFIFFRWEPLALEVNAQEVLQLVQYCQDTKSSICLSDRHKEIFSLLHLFYTFVIILETPISLNDAFQLHMARCNGFMIDRMEMLFAMYFLVSWAEKARVIPVNLQQTSLLWKDTYERMAAFRSTHPNVVTIHPDHLTDISDDVVMEIARSGGFPPPRFSNRNDSIMTDKFVCRWNARVGEADLKKVRLEEIGAIRSDENVAIMKEEIEELPGTSPEEEVAQDDTYMYMKKRYRGNFNDLWEAERKQIESLKRKRGKKSMEISPDIIVSAPMESIESKEQPAYPLPQYPSQDHVSKEDFAKPARETQPVINALPPFSRSMREPRKADGFIMGERPEKPEGTFAKLKKVLMNKFKAILGSRAKQSFLNASTPKKSTPTVPSGGRRSRKMGASPLKLSQDPSTPKISSDETLHMFAEISAEPSPQVNVGSSLEGRRPPVWRKIGEEANQLKVDDRSCLKLSKSYPGTFEKEVKAPPVWRKASSIAAVETPSGEK